MAQTYADERISDIWNDVAPLADEHWREVMLGSGGYQPDRGIYESAEASGNLVVYTARDRLGNLVGYAAYVLGPDAHSLLALHATADAIYVRPRYRSLGVGIGLLRYAESRLREHGVIAIHHHVTPARDFSGFLRRMGYEQSSITYTKHLETSCPSPSP